ncbi:MAG: hypothetical protein OXH84_02790 [Gammaproteobacteria bacterium]|nr:hypothetical protein [Gammaproteobacteria bacterium]
MHRRFVRTLIVLALCFSWLVALAATQSASFVVSLDETNPQDIGDTNDMLGFEQVDDLHVVIEENGQDVLYKVEMDYVPYHAIDLESDWLSDSLLLMYWERLQEISDSRLQRLFAANSEWLFADNSGSFETPTETIFFEFDLTEGGELATASLIQSTTTIKGTCSLTAYKPKVVMVSENGGEGFAQVKGESSGNCHLPTGSNELPDGLEWSIQVGIKGPGGASAESMPDSEIEKNPLVWPSPELSAKKNCVVGTWEVKVTAKIINTNTDESSKPVIAKNKGKISSCSTETENDD